MKALNMNKYGYAALCAISVIWGTACLGAEDRRTVEDTAVAKTQELAAGEPLVPGPFQPTYESLKAYQCPEWYQDAKFGIWAHWGPQGVGQIGDWYARNMYVEGSGTYKYHVEKFGHPSKFGFKDIIQLWKAEKFDPDRLISLYKKAGAKYFVSMGCHHDNFDLWDSKYHRWNAVNMGPKKDIVGLWQAATVKQGLRFGVSEHMAPSFKWFSVAHNSDKEGPLAGVPYDGNDPANFDLYGPKPEKIWSAGAELWQETNMPESWKLEWFHRCDDLLANYKPDYVYSDYGNVPFRREVGWRLLANYYNRSISDHGGKLEAVYTGKGETERVYVRDFESGAAGEVRAEPWQMDWCLANFYYDKRLKIRSAATVIRLLADVVSKNGNLLLSVPQKPDGSLDEQTEVFLTDMEAWMAINGEAIFGTRPFKVFGEGPTVIDDFRKTELPYTPKDIRFTRKGNTLYALVLGVPEREITMASLAKESPLVLGDVSNIELLGYPGKLAWARARDGLIIQLPAAMPNRIALVFRITGLDDLAHDGLIYPAMNGDIMLNVAAAERHGKQFSVTGGKGMSHIAGWMNSGEWLSWKVKVPYPGAYAVSVVSSAAGGASQFTIDAGDASIAGKFPATQSWEDYQTASLGQLTVKESGAVTVSFRPGDGGNWRPLNLAAVTLKPVKNGTSQQGQADKQE
jgi:alpha-L-fucosidase